MLLTIKKEQKKPNKYKRTDQLNLRDENLNNS